MKHRSLFFLVWLASLLVAGSALAQTPESKPQLPPPTGSAPDTGEAAESMIESHPEGAPGAEEKNPASPPSAPTNHEPQPSATTRSPAPAATPAHKNAPALTAIKKYTPHLKSFGASLGSRSSFDGDGPIGGAQFSLYYFPNRYLGLAVSGFNIVSMTFGPNGHGDRDGGGGSLSITYFPFKYNPEGYSYYVKAGALYEQVHYVLDPELDLKEKAHYFGVEAGAGVMFTLGSTLSLGIEASFLGSIARDKVAHFTPEANAGPLDRAALTLKLYLMVRWNLFTWVQGPDGKFREDKSAR